MNDFQNIISKSTSLQMLLDETQENNSVLKENFEEEIKRLKSRNEHLERTTEQTSLNSHQLFSQLAELKIQKQVIERKYTQASEKLQILEDDFKRGREQLFEAEKINKELYAKLEEQNIISRAPFGPAFESSGSTRIKKSIRGGGGKLPMPFNKLRIPDSETETGSRQDTARSRILSQDRMITMPNKDNCKPF